MPDSEAPLPETLSLQEQTIVLGKMLKAISDEDPFGSPSQRAAAAFTAWLAEAGPGSREPHYFNDVATNYEVTENSNRDLWDLFDILENYIEVEDEPADEERTFISLPLLGDSA